MRIHVLDLRNKGQTQGEFNLYAKSLLNENIRSYIIENTEFCYSDDMSFLPNEDVIEFLVDSFKEYYFAIRLFHGCRPMNIENYFLEGIVTQNSKKLYDLSSEIFTDIHENLLREAFQKVDEQWAEKGSVFFTSDDKILVTESGHYLIQGSEFIQALAIELENTPGVYGCRQKLKELGTPTIFEVEIPISFFSDSQIRNIIYRLISNWGNMLLGIGDSEGTNNLDEICFEIKQPIASLYIVNHYHPEEIVDPHNHNIIFQNKINSCGVCENKI